MDFTAYLLRCADGSYYAGHTDNLEQRMGQHQTGLFGGYTARRRPVTLVWSERFATRDEAFAAERKLKGWSRAKKEALIAGDWAMVSALARNRQGEVERGANILRQAQDERGWGGNATTTETTQVNPEQNPEEHSEQSKTARAEPVEAPRATPDQSAATLTQTAHAAILKAAAHAAPNEACGLLLGHGTRIHTAEPAANVHPDAAYHFEIDPAALIAAHKAARARGPQVLGYFHSHPNGLARPSATDSASASGDGRVWAIAAGGEISLWRDGPSGFEPLSYSLDDG